MTRSISRSFRWRFCDSVTGGWIGLGISRQTGEQGGERGRPGTTTTQKYRYTSQGGYYWYFPRVLRSTAVVIHLAINRDLDARQATVPAPCSAVVLLLAACKPVGALLPIGNRALTVDVARVDPLSLGVRLARTGGAKPTGAGVDADDVGGAVLAGLEARRGRSKALRSCSVDATCGVRRGAPTCTNTGTRWTSAREVVGRAAVGRVDGRAGVDASLGEGSADGENDAKGHGGGEDGGHRGDGGLDGVLVVSGLDDEPEEHVDHVNKPDCTIEVEAIAKHELPRREGLDLE